MVLFLDLAVGFDNEILAFTAGFAKVTLSMTGHIPTKKNPNTVNNNIL